MCEAFISSVSCGHITCNSGLDGNVHICCIDDLYVRPGKRTCNWAGAQLTESRLKGPNLNDSGLMYPGTIY